MSQLVPVALEALQTPPGNKAGILFSATLSGTAPGVQERLLMLAGALEANPQASDILPHTVQLLAAPAGWLM